MRRLFLALLPLLLASCGPEDTSEGRRIYQERCGSCHNSIESKAPMLATLRQMSSRRVLRALDFGAMMEVAYPLNRSEREAIATWLGRGAETAPAVNYCADRTVALGEPASSDWIGWSPGSANARFQPNGGITAENAGQLKLKWVFGFEGDVNAIAPPTAIGENLFVGSAAGIVHALDRRTGCTRWMFQAGGPVRVPPAIAPLGGGHALLFGDQIGWFYAVEAQTGRLLWKNRPEQHEAARLTGTPVVHQGVVYVPAASWDETRAQNFRGSVTAMRVSDGSQVWKTYMVPEPGPSGAGIWSSATLDTKRGLLYVTSDAVVALRVTTGAIAWSRQFANTDGDFGSSVILAKIGARDVLLAGHKSGVVYALDPGKRGEIVWQERVGKGGPHGGVLWGMAAGAANVYAAVSDAAQVRNPGKSRLDPYPDPLDPNTGGGLTALRVRDGAKLWFAPPAPCDRARPRCSPAQPAAVTAIPGAVFSGSLDGHLRAFSASDGTLLWDFDTAREWTAVNGVKAQGGSLDGAGPVVAGGMVFVHSGYAVNGGIPGNVLLAFGLE